MTNVVSMNCTCDFLVKRAARHRRSGRYDEAMPLLWKARNQFGQTDAVLWEMAQVYDEMGCEEEAEQTYLRLVRLRGTHRPDALFHLTVSCVQRGDFQRAASYFESFRQSEQPGDISAEMTDILARQMEKETNSAFSFRARQRAKTLAKRASASLQAGRVAAAQRAMEHALRIKSSACGYTMLACCQLLRMKFDDAASSARTAHAKSPSNVQTLCVLADAYMAGGEHKKAINTIYLAYLRAHQVDDLMAVCVESAKAQCDQLTVLVANRILKIEPFHTKAMKIRACALINQGKSDQAERMFGRLCGLLPENSVCESYYRLLRDQYAFTERLSLGVDVIRSEGVARAAELLTLLYQDPKSIDDDTALCAHVCRMCDWAFHSPMAGPSTKMSALVLLAGLQSDEAKGVLLDLLISPHLADSLKLSALQVLTAKDGFYPYDVDMGGKLVRLSAGGVSHSAIRPSEPNSRIVQRAADRLSAKYPNAAQMILNAFLAYLDVYGQPEKRHESVCTAALECWYMLSIGKPVNEQKIAGEYNVTVRMLRKYVRRITACMKKIEKPQQGE